MSRFPTCQSRGNISSWQVERVDSGDVIGTISSYPPLTAWYATAWLGSNIESCISAQCPWFAIQSRVCVRETWYSWSDKGMTSALIVIFIRLSSLSFIFAEMLNEAKWLRPRAKARSLRSGPRQRPEARDQGEGQTLKYEIKLYFLRITWIFFSTRALINNCKEMMAQ